MSNIFETISKGIKNWWIPMLVGLILIALGIYIFTVPDITFAAESFVFAIAFIIMGVAEIYFAVDNRAHLQGWGWYLTGGILALIVGAVLVLNPNVAEAIFPYVFAFLLLFRSIQGLGLSFDMKSYGILDWGNVAIVSVLGILFSFLLLIYPMFSEAVLITLAGLAFIFVGIVGVVIGYNLKRIKDLPKTLSKDLQDKINEIKQNIQDEANDIKSNVSNAMNTAKQNVDDAVSKAKQKVEDISDDVQNAANNNNNNS